MCKWTIYIGKKETKKQRLKERNKETKEGESVSELVSNSDQHRAGGSVRKRPSRNQATFPMPRS